MLFRREWSLQDLEPPWPPGSQSIFRYLEVGGGEQLPDDQVHRVRGVRVAPGLLDGVFGGAGGVVEGDDVARLLSDLSRRATNRRLRSLYQVLQGESPLSYLDTLIERLEVDSASLQRQRMREIGLYLATESPHRDPAKVGLALMGLFGWSSDVPLIRTMGAHDEFTLYAGVALARLSDDPESELWALAKKVHGWGRIHLVRLLAETDRPDIQAWMLRDGCSNSIMDEYLACVCAKAGRLHVALAEAGVDDALLDATGHILQALIRGGPAEGIDDYEAAPQVIERYLHLVWARPGRELSHLLAVVEIRAYLTNRAAKDPGWSAELLQKLDAVCSDILEKPEWVVKAKRSLESEDEAELWRADRVCKVLDIDTWD